jgi:hypothetical protein
MVWIGYALLGLIAVLLWNIDRSLAGIQNAANVQVTHLAKLLKAQGIQPLDSLDERDLDLDE